MKNIASALVKAQKAFGPALKTNTNPHFKSKYADLAACIEAVIDGLNDHDIALVQATHECSDGVIVETLFLHGASGETLSAGKLHVPASKQDAQGYGSALTYARRYSLMAACGIAPEDDDGNASSPQVDRTLVMKVRNKIQEHIANDRQMGVLEEWDFARSKGQPFQEGVWSGLTTPEREYIRGANETRGRG